ncbi:unnamed protein product [Didymodactylos carnosus]|uniref:Uncharacterized protein n=1 Tax=Didymodactylos carnosus TaxID=1234261 RepID=A0A813WZK2_9BILA|nr:unnamed protein product [Didymodactylos carnosus]CAF3645727.1 unnamed protein product [Didymodactylos carnosus]
MPIIDILIEPVYERRRLLYTLLKNLYDYCESNGYTKIIGFVSTTIKRPQYSTKTNNSLYMSYINAGFLNCGYINNGRYIQMEATFMNNLKICKKAIQLSIDTLYEKEIKHFQQKQDTQQSITTNDSIEEYRKKNKNKKTVRFA